MAVTAGSLSLAKFRVADTWFGLNTEDVEEICAYETPTPIPRAPPHITGLINLRGRAVPVVSLARFFGLDEAPPDIAEGWRTLVVQKGGMRVGLICEQMQGIDDIGNEHLRTPETLTQRLREFSQGEVHLEERIVAVIDLAALLAAARA
jgi:purine-binding chemotaxis protein CheW